MLQQQNIGNMSQGGYWLFRAYTDEERDAGKLQGGFSNPKTNILVACILGLLLALAIVGLAWLCISCCCPKVCLLTRSRPTAHKLTPARS